MQNLVFCGSKKPCMRWLKSNIVYATLLGGYAQKAETRITSPSVKKKLGV